MANIVQKDHIWIVRFRHLGREYKRSLKTRDKSDAEAGKRTVEQTLYRLRTGLLRLPSDVDWGDFIVSGGTRVAMPPPAPAVVLPTTSSLIDRYLESKKPEIAETYYATQNTHLRHLKKHLGKLAERACNLVTQRVLEEFLFARQKCRHPNTVQHERTTLLLFYKWVAEREDIPEFPLPTNALPKFEGSIDRPRFRTIDETNEILARGGLDPEQILDQWECLYLAPAEIAGLLTTVRANSQDELSFLLHAMPAYTGMRRGEMLKLKWVDVDLDRGFLTARSRKQSRRKMETTRTIDLHDELRNHLVSWKQQRPKGQFVLSEGRSLEALTVHRGNRLFWLPMRNTDWCLDGSRNWFKIGFHTYRHSFASNLAAAGVDQRIIDEFMGHTTLEMRMRYRHLFPKNRRSAIESFSLVAPVAMGQSSAAVTINAPEQTSTSIS